MSYIAVIEKIQSENERYREALLKISNRKMSMYLSKDHMLSDFIKIANEALRKD